MKEKNIEDKKFDNIKQITPKNKELEEFNLLYTNERITNNEENIKEIFADNICEDEASDNSLPSNVQSVGRISPLILPEKEEIFQVSPLLIDNNECSVIEEEKPSECITPKDSIIKADYLNIIDSINLRDGENEQNEILSNINQSNKTINKAKILVELDYEQANVLSNDVSKNDLLYTKISYSSKNTEIVPIYDNISELPNLISHENDTLVATEKSIEGLEIIEDDDMKPLAPRLNKKSENDFSIRQLTDKTKIINAEDLPKNNCYLNEIRNEISQEEFNTLEEAFNNSNYINIGIRISNPIIVIRSNFISYSLI